MILFREQIAYPLALVSRPVGGKDVIEGAILANDHDNMLNRGFRLSITAFVILRGLLAATAIRAIGIPTAKFIAARKASPTQPLHKTFPTTRLIRISVNLLFEVIVRDLVMPPNDDRLGTPRLLDRHYGSTKSVSLFSV